MRGIHNLYNILLVSALLVANAGVRPEGRSRSLYMDAALVNGAITLMAGLTDQPISDEERVELRKMANREGSGCNEEPWKYYGRMEEGSLVETATIRSCEFGF